MGERERRFRAVGGEHPLPLEHTARVEATRGPPEPVAAVPAASGGDGRERRARRRDRDAAAERRAIQVVVAVFVGLGGAGFAALNLLEGDPSEPVRRPAVPDAPPGGSPPAPPAARESAAAAPAEPNIPALRHLSLSGLTIGAEGIPRVASDAPGVAERAGVETCRFAYGIWEFSPNQTFRFLSTCRGLGRLQLVGAYEVRGGSIHLSELAHGSARWTSVFDVERPSTMTTQVVHGGARLEVHQRVTVVRGGLNGEDFRDSFQRRNTLVAPELGSPPRDGPAPGSPDKAPPAGSALEQLLGG